MNPKKSVQERSRNEANSLSIFLNPLSLLHTRSNPGEATVIDCGWWITRRDSTPQVENSFHRLLFHTRVFIRAYVCTTSVKSRLPLSICVRVRRLVLFRRGWYVQHILDAAGVIRARNINVASSAGNDFVPWTTRRLNSHYPWPNLSPRRICAPP